MCPEKERNKFMILKHKFKMSPIYWISQTSTLSEAPRLPVCLVAPRETWWEATESQSLGSSSSALKTGRQEPGTGGSLGPS